MDGTTEMRPLVVVIYPYKFHEFVYELLELDRFERYCEVEVWDVSALLTAGFSMAVSAERSSRRTVFAVATWQEFIGRVLTIRRASADRKICIINELPANSSSELLATLMVGGLLRSKPVLIVDLYNGGIPLRETRSNTDAAVPDSPVTFLARARRLLRDTSSIREFARTVRSYAFARLSRQLPTFTTHRLFAGADWEILARRRAGQSKKIVLVAGHSSDYSNNLLHRLMRTPVSPTSRIGVMLDGAGPMFGSDAALLGRKVYFTSEAWYPALTRLFDRIERATGTRIEIAGHYKTTHPPVAPYFGNRRVHYGRTWELVQSSEFVITRASTAISYAIANRKPIILVYSNQLAEDRVAMRGGLALGAMLNTRLVNVDELQEIDVRSLLKIDEQRYREYEHACLTSDCTGRPNVQIVLEDVMEIATGPDLYRRD